MNMYSNLFLENNIKGDNMMLENIMTKNIIVGNINNNIFEISKLMQDYNIGFIPIVENNKIVGVITDRDIVINCLSNNETSSNSIKSYITKNIINIDINKKIEDAIKLMGEKKIKRLIVTNNKKVKGIISLSDIINNYENDKLIIENFKKIYEITNNSDYFTTNINEFYL